MDLMPRKAEVKGMIQEELTKLADEADEDEEDGDGEKEDDNDEQEGEEGA
uniref:Uncharacterized protein n=6 Tax=Nymphaea colorata TaxID=210225 RepID=A0A5K1F4E7_9MAGN|nr:unnamed protein product [Nymphaea colorata]